MAALSLISADPISAKFARFEEVCHQSVRIYNRAAEAFEDCSILSEYHRGRSSSDHVVYLHKGGKKLGQIIFSVPFARAVHVNNLDSYNNDEYKFVGVQLMKIALICSRVLGNGVIELESLPGAVGFYERLGFKIDYEAYTERFDDEREMREDLGAQLEDMKEKPREWDDQLFMILPERRSPILMEYV